MFTVTTPLFGESTADVRRGQALNLHTASYEFSRDLGENLGSAVLRLGACLTPYEAALVVIGAAESAYDGAHRSALTDMMLAACELLGIDPTDPEQIHQ